MGQRLREIWLSRELLVYLVRTEIKVKYKNSVLGLVWSMISPAMTLAIYFIVFQFISKNGIPNFVIFLFSGLLLWNLFQLGVQTGTGVIVNNAGIVKKVSFPREILALASVGSALVFFFFQSLVMVIFLVVFHSAPAWGYLPLLPLALVAAMVLAAGLAILLSAVNVYLRDTQHLIEVVMTAWFWACPIVYSFQAVIAPKLGPKGITWVYFLNPMTPLVLSFQRALYGHRFNVVKHRDAPAVLVTTELPPHGLRLVRRWLDGRVLGGRHRCSSWSRSTSSAASRATSPRSSEMSEIAVDVKDVSKRFRLAQGRYNSVKERLIHGRTSYEDFWALREVSMNVREGETVGILGRNGSGKSTLLKCICGVLQPTSGEVVVRGKLAGLLELGAGFQQDLTGWTREHLPSSTAPCWA